MTHNGKIGRLPRNIRDELNHRMDEGELGERILEWHNALPEVRQVLARDFGGQPLNGQNLTNWRAGGFPHWLAQQKRRATVGQLTEDARELNADAGGLEAGNHLSAVLVAELAASARDELATLTDPAQRCARTQEFLQTVARVRRQDNQDGRLAIERERRARERDKEKQDDADKKEWAREWAPVYRQFQRSYMADCYAQPDFNSQLAATREAESLLRGLKPDGSHPEPPAAPVEPELD